MKAITDMTDCTNPLGPSNKAKNAVRKNIKSIRLAGDDKICRLVRFIAKREGVNEQNVMLGHDLAERICAYVFRDAGCTAVGVVSPVPPSLAHLLERLNVEPSRYELSEENGFTFGIEELKRLIHDVGLLFLPVPHPVTGTVIPALDLGDLIGEAERTGKVLVVDESFREFTGLPSPVPGIGTLKTTVILRTFSTFHALAGFSLQYAIGGTGIIERLKKMLPMVHVQPLAAVAALASLRDAGYRKRTAAFISGEKLYIKGKLRKMEGIEIIDTQCNFILIKIGKESRRLREALLKKNVMVDTYPVGKNECLLFHVPVRRRKENARFAKVLAGAGNC